MTSSIGFNDDIWKRIMLWFPADCLIRFRGVNKHLSNLITRFINNPMFLSRHLLNIKSNNTYNTRFTLRYLLYKCDEPGHVRGHLPLLTLFNDNNENGPIYSFIEGLAVIPAQKYCDARFYHCDGIICIAKDFVQLWNPMFKEVKFIGRPENLDSALGMGFGLATGPYDYKVVVIGCGFKEIESHSYATVHLYSMRSKAWKEIAPVHFSSPLYSDVHCKGVCYWLTGRQVKSGNGSAVLAFDLGNEKFHYLFWPSDLREAKGNQLKLAVLNDSVALICYPEPIGPHAEMIIWLMNDCFQGGNGYGGACTWTRYLTLGPLWGNPIPLMFWTNDELLLECHDTGSLRTYNFRSNRSRNIVIWQKSRMTYFACSYVKTLVPVISKRRGQLYDNLPS